jgi:hypothetical protein
MRPGIYPRGIPKVVCVCMVPSVHPCTICRHTFGGPLAYVRTKDKGVCPETLTFVRA